ncbi:MAG TPA: potassium channel protein [Halobacteria archaeon]|jgi:uncharacterized protein with PhoU and TrkA domain|nr:potassium channel protein [Halobacteria archaeon]
MKKIEYRPYSVKNLIKEMKDTSELMIALSYYSMLYYSKDIAREVLHLEEIMNCYTYHVRISAILGARNVNEAEEMAGVLQVANSAELISNAAGDIAKLVLKDMRIPKSIIPLLKKTEETVVRTDINEKSSLAGKTLGELRLETETGMRVIALRRKNKWIFNADKDTMLLPGDIIIAEGPDDGVPILYELATGNPYTADEIVEEGVNSEMDDATELITEMKNLFELAVSLAYGALLFNNEDLAHEVRKIESKMDEMHYELELLILRCAKYTDDYNGLRCLLGFSSSAEIISDAANEMVDILFRDIGTHPALILALKEADEIITAVIVDDGSEIDGKMLDDLNLETEIGMDVIAIRRDNLWIFRPSNYFNFVLKGGDIIIAKGTREGEKELKEMSTNKKVDIWYDY